MEEQHEQTDKPEAAVDEAEGLLRENEMLRRELESRSAAIVGLEQVLAERDGEIVVLKDSQEEAGRKMAELGEALVQTVADYRELLVQANPGVLAELITGETVAEVDESLKHARALVERVRQEMEAEASRTRIPAGAPQRVPLDLSALSPREKIQYAVGGSQS